MKICLACRSVNIVQKSSILTRLFFSTYMFLAFYFFTGDIGYGTLILFIPLFLPYMHNCNDCSRSFFNMPKVKLNSFWVGNNLDKYFLGLLPSILTITLLILNFPNTGLGRIVYLPGIFFVNSLIIGVFLYKSKKSNETLNLILWVMIIVITVVLSVLSYPQEYGEGILELLFSK